MPASSSGASLRLALVTPTFQVGVNHLLELRAPVGQETPSQRLGGTNASWKLALVTPTFQVGVNHPPGPHARGSLETPSRRLGDTDASCKLAPLPCATADAQTQFGATDWAKA